MLKELAGLEISPDAVTVVDAMRDLKVGNRNEHVGVYRFIYQNEECEAEALEECLDIYCECCLRIVDRLEELRQNGLTTETVRAFIAQESNEGANSPQSYQWIAIKSFQEDGPLNDPMLHEMLHLIAGGMGVPSDSASYMFLYRPTLQAMVLCVAELELEMDEITRLGVAWTMLRTILRLENRYK